VDIAILLRGLILGFSIAAPVGPIGVLCIRRTLADGRLNGFVSGLGAATADAFYGSIAAFGLTFISGLLFDLQGGLRLIGGLFLCYLGLKTFLARPAALETAVNGHGLDGAYASTLFLTLTNPMTIISFTAIFAGLGVFNSGGSYLTAGLLVAGVFAGSALWWFLLSGLTALFRARLGASLLLWINRASGIVITAFGLLALASLVR
jgi:threonine/homoserine/homoserine lactone efflux protein